MEFVFGFMFVLGLISGAIGYNVRLRKRRRKESLERCQRQKRTESPSGYTGASGGGQGALQQVIAYQQGLTLKKRSVDLDQLLRDGATYVGDVRSVENDQLSPGDPWGDAVGQSTIQRR